MPGDLEGYDCHGQLKPALLSGFDFDDLWFPPDLLTCSLLLLRLGEIIAVGAVSRALTAESAVIGSRHLNSGCGSDGW